MRIRRGAGLRTISVLRERDGAVVDHAYFRRRQGAFGLKVLNESLQQAKRGVSSLCHHAFLSRAIWA